LATPGATLDRGENTQMLTPEQRYKIRATRAHDNSRFYGASGPFYILDYSVKIWGKLVRDGFATRVDAEQERQKLIKDDVRREA